VNGVQRNEHDQHHKKAERSTRANNALRNLFLSGYTLSDSFSGHFLSAILQIFFGALPFGIFFQDTLSVFSTAEIPFPRIASNVPAYWRRRGLDKCHYEDTTFIISNTSFLEVTAPLLPICMLAEVDSVDLNSRTIKDVDEKK